MKNKYSYSYSIANPKISPIIRNTSKNLLIRKVKTMYSKNKLIAQKNFKFKN